MKINARPYRDEEDYIRIRTLLQDIYAIGGPSIYCSVGDLDYWRFRCFDDPDAAIATARLWEKADGELIGAVWPDSGNRVDLFVHPYHHHLSDEMLAWAEAWCLKIGSADAEKLELTTWCLETDDSLKAVLRRRGYERTDHYMHWYKMRSLDEPIPEFSLPAGYSIRHARGKEDLEQLVAVTLSAFPLSTTTVKNRWTMMTRSPTYRPELDLVVVDEDGSFAAFCVAWYDERNRFGVFEPIGCHEQHRRRGLTKAVMVEALRRLKRFGATVAAVGAEGDNVASNALYESLGFQTHDYNYLWKKVTHR